MCCRERQDQLERAWWEEKAELSAGPAEQGAGGRFSDSKQEPESGHTSWQVADSAAFCVTLGMARAACHVQLELVKYPQAVYTVRVWLGHTIEGKEVVARVCNSTCTC